MANVNLPNTDGMTTMDELRNAVGKMTKELSWLLNNLDTRNVNELNAEVIIAESITGDKIQAGAITAGKIDVDQLSAISADLGSITAGVIRGIKIFGSLISTSETQYPRVVLDPSSTAFGVYADEYNGVKIPAYDNGVSKIIFLENGNETTLYNSPTLGFVISGFNGIYVTGTGITLDPISGFIRVPSWGKVISQATGTSLQDEFDSIRSELAGKANVSHSHSVTIPAHVHNPATSSGGGGTFSVS
jgi:hypothetical protein